MTTNAARELLELVNAWPDSGTVASTRDGTDPAGRDLWEAEERAVRLLADVEAFIAMQPDAEEYADFIHELRSFVFAPDVSWHANGQGFDPTHRLVLRTVSRLMDRSPLAVSLDPAGMDTVKKALEEALHVLEGQDGVLEERLQYVAHLIRRCLQLIECDPADLLGLKALSIQIAGESTGVPADALPEEDRQRFTNAIRTVMTHVVAPSVAGAIGNLASTGALGLLGP